VLETYNSDVSLGNIILSSRLVPSRHITKPTTHADARLTQTLIR
jgi:hypothetical protein